jgi:DNA-binding IclR family transcriptional regulator
MIGKDRGAQIRLLVRLYSILDSTVGLTATDIVKRTGMSKRQVYRWLDVLEQEKEVVRFGYYPARWRRRKRKVKRA